MKRILGLLAILALGLLGNCSRGEPGRSIQDPDDSDTVPKTPCGLPTCPDTVPKTPCGLPVCPDTIPKTPCGKPVCEDTLPPGADTAALRERADSLAGMGFRAAVAFARDSGHSAESPLRWTGVDADSSGYAWSIQQLGMFRRLFVLSRVRLGGYVLTRRLSALVGQELSLDEYPALGLTNTQGNMVLALGAEISGPVLLSRGSVRKATESSVRYTGNTGTVMVWDSTFPAWKTLPMRFPSARAWLSSAAGELQDLSAGPVRDEAWDSNLVFQGPAVLPPGIRRHDRIFATGRLVIGPGVDLRDCRVAAAEISIEGDARIEGGVVFSAGRMSITGSPSLKGQFLSRDTLLLAVQSRLEGYPVFFAEGRNDGLVHAGALRVLQAQGEGIFLSDSPPVQTHNRAPSLVFGTGTDLQGFASTDFHMDPRGRFRGCILGQNLSFVLGETVYVGFLGYGDFGLAPYGLKLFFPAIRQGAEPAITGRTVWDGN